jgi:CheY-like chemotaxis protein
MNIALAMIVDDSKMARITLKKQLESKEIAVFLAESGEESLDLLKSNQPDIIFMDCLMPGIDGFEATRQIQSNPDTSSIPIVMCTGKETDEDKQKAFDLGAAGYMIKSSSLEPLHAILDEISHLDEHINDPIIPETESASTVTPPPLLDISEITRIAEQAANAIASSMSAQFSSDLNSKVTELTKQLEQKVSFSVESSLKDVHKYVQNDVHKYVDSKIEHLNKEVLPELKNDISTSLTDVITNSMENGLQPLRKDFELLKSEMTHLDTESLIEQQIQQQLAQHFQQNLPTYAAKIMENEASRTLIGSMIQKQLSGHKGRLDTLEELSAAKNKSTSKNLSLFALVMGTSALVIAIYQLLQ